MSKTSSSENPYLEIVESLDDMIYELDADGRFYYFNISLIKNSGYSKSQLSKMKYYELVRADYMPILADFYKKQRAEKIKTTYFEFPILNKNKEVIWVGQNVTMAFDSNGHTTKTRAVARNITETLDIQNKLKRNTKLLFQAQSMANIGHWEVELSNNKIFWSDITRSIHEVDKDYEPKLEEAIQFYTDESRPIIEKVVNKGIEDGTDWDVTLEIITGKGNRKWVRSIGHSEMINGKVEKIFGVFQDITKDKHLEIELRKAKKQSDLNSKAKDEFLSTMSHEIRTPLNAIIGMSHLLTLESNSKEQVENLNILKFSSENLLALVNNILDFTKIESENVKLEKVSFDFYELINNIKNSFSLRAEEKGILLNVIADTSVPQTLIGDPTRLTQILTNLLSNGIKFTEQGRVKLTIYTVKSTADKVSLEFTVEDTGIGIAKDKQKLIFERFTQAEEETTRKYGGSGLGLAIIKKLIQLHGEEIHLKSKLGVGSAFSFKIGFDKGQSSTIQKKEEQVADPQVDLSGIQVLVVEDDRINQIVIRKYLNGWGVKADIVSSGKEAISMVNAKVYDIILMDIQMPEMDGYQTTEEIRKVESCQLTPILALTAELDAEVKRKGLNAGMNDILTKPINGYSLQRKLITYLNIGAKLSNVKDKAVGSKHFIDVSFIIGLAAGDDEFLGKIIVSYNQELDKLKDEYRTIIYEGDQKGYKDLAHKTEPALLMLKADLLKNEIKRGATILSTGSDKEKEINVKNVARFCDTIIEITTAQIPEPKL